MSNSIHSLQAAHAQTQTEQTVQPPKKPLATTQNPVPQDKVTISKASQQARAATTKPAASGDVNHHGDSA
jgi:hypothetical protein